MGKLAILLATASILGGSTLLFQYKQSSVQTDWRQAERQGQMVAREIARSGHNAVLSRTRQLQREYPDDTLEETIARVNGTQGYITGSYQGGSYEARVYLTSASTFAVESIGYYAINEHEIRSESDEAGFLDDGILEVTEPSTLRVSFLESMAGYCSAIYLQRILPDVAPEDQPEPELIFTPGHNRDGATTEPQDIVLDPGTTMNFIMAVDADFSCEEEGNVIPITHGTFEYTRDALVSNVGTLDEMTEGKYAMIQENPNRPGVWRIAFEDLFFSDEKLSDTKQNGYGSTTWDAANQTYGGNGWTETDSNGYWLLEDYGGKPDFSDQVIEVELLPVGDQAL